MFGVDLAYVSNVVYPFVTGGAERRIHEIGRRLAARGHRVTVYGRRFWDGPRETSHDGVRLVGVGPERELYAGDRRSIPEAMSFAVRLFRPLRRAAADHDLVVVSVFPYFPVLTAAAALAGNDTPLATTWHEWWGDYWWEYLGPLAPGGQLVERIVAAVPQHPVAVSSVTADQVDNHRPGGRPTRVLPNGVDVNHVRSVEPAADGFDVVFIGRLVSAKRVDRLLKVLAEIDGVTLGVIGDGPERTALAETAQSLGIADRVTFLGELDDGDAVLAHLRAAPVFASASEREGFGITAIEAMAAGCTTVVTRHPNSAASEVVGDAGLIAPPTVAGLAQTLRRAVNGTSLDRNPVARAREFDWDRIADRAEETYRSIVE